MNSDHKIVSQEGLPFWSLDGQLISCREDDEKYYFDPQAAADAVNFFETCLVHVMGEWAGLPFILEPWQRTPTEDVFGWKRRSDGTRRYRMVYIEIPRKNGKSTYVAGCVLEGEFAEKEQRAECFSAAGDKDQAKIIFDLARDMVLASEALSQRATVYQNSIVNRSYNSTYKAVSADARGKWGSNPHVVAFDELFVQPDRQLYDAMTTGVGTRRQPLAWILTTAGWDKSSIGYEVHCHADNILRGALVDESFYPVVYAAPQDADIFDPAVIARCNPSLGRTLKLDAVEEEVKRARESITFRNTYRRVRLNQWTEQETKWLDVDKWKQCASSRPQELRASLKGSPCTAGLDLSSRLDLTALTLNFQTNSGTKTLHYFWCPAATISKRALKDRVPYDEWVRCGFLRETPGDVVDYDFVRRDVNKIADEFPMLGLGIDEWNATQIAVQLEGDGLPVVLMRQGFKTMSEPSKELEKMIVGRTIEHDANPIMTWMVANVAKDTDAAGNIKPSKEKSRERIDGITATVMAHGLAIRSPEDQGSVYDEREVRVL